MAISVGAGIAFIVGGSALKAVSGAQSFTLPILGALQPWQLAFVIVGLPGLLVAACMLLVREPPRQGLGVEAERIPWPDVWRFLVERKALIGYVFASASGLTALGYSYLNWYPSFLIRTYGMAPHVVGYHFGLLYMVFGTIGAYGGARLTEYFAARGYEDAPLRTIAIAAIGMIPTSLGFLMPSAPLAYIFAAIAFVFVNSFTGLAATALQLIAPNRMRGVISALYLMVSSLVGLTLGASAVASMTDFVFHDDLALRYSLVVVTALLAPVSAVLIWGSLGPYRAALGVAQRWAPDARPGESAAQPM
jgi:hypothetical protein